MYIVKNALKCIGRTKGRYILIGVIVLVIAVSACLGLSIRQAAESAKEKTISTLSITATISFDRSALMNDIKEMGIPPEEGESLGEGKSFDRSQFSEMMGESASLTLEEYETYASAESVKEFYYTVSVSLNGSADFEPVSNDSTSETTSEFEDLRGEEENGNIPGDFDGRGGGRIEMMMGVQSDFSVLGYSSENAMTDFIDGTSQICDGSVFEEKTQEYVCIISEELAAYNDISVNDIITLANPNNEDEVYDLTVVGIYSDSAANESSFSMMGATSTDPANKIYMSYAALQNIIDASTDVSTTQTDDETGMEFETGLTGTLSGTYVFEDTDDYYRFEEEVRELGLDESYTISSSDITSFENSLVPLNTLSTMAGYFLIIILLIGAIILVVLNIFNVRERKYEIGVLTAMGMKKTKVAFQFLTEIFVVTLAAVLIGICIGAVSSVPVTNALLKNQISSQQSNESKIEENFGRGDMSIPGKDNSEFPGGSSDAKDGGFFGNPLGTNSEDNYVSEITSAMNFTVVFQMLGIAILLTLVAGVVSMLFVMRYDPLKILANRD